MSFLRRLLAPALGAVALTAVTGITVLTRDARACGGGVFVSYDPASEPEQIVVAGHRIALSISDLQTVAWSQIHYNGPPREFAWVVPVIKDSKVQLADEAFLDALDTFTSTEIKPNVLCATEHGGSSGGGIGCGSAAGGDTLSRNAAYESNGVTVEQQSSIGPYETVTLSSPDGEAVRTWLVGHGYPVPASITPILADYSAKGLSFAALRLKADASTLDMKPVRVVMPARVETTALRMMLAGTGAHVPITLFVMADETYAPQNFPRVTVDRTKLEFDYAAKKSNYEALRIETLAQGKGDGWLAAYAGMPFAHESAAKLVVGVAQPRPYKLDDLYFALAAARAKKVDPCATRPSRFAECDGHSDLAAATRGLRDPRLVRLEFRFPRAVIDRDLELTKTTEFGSFSSSPSALQVLTPAIQKNVPCADYVLDDGTARPKHASAWLLAGLLPLAHAARRSVRRLLRDRA